MCDCVFWGNKNDFYEGREGGTAVGRETCCILCDVQRGEHGFLKLALVSIFDPGRLGRPSAMNSRLIKNKKRPRTPK